MKLSNFVVTLHPKGFIMTSISQELLIQMRKDLFAAYRDVASKPCPSQRIAYERTVLHPAPRYYIEPEKAATIVYNILRGNYKVIENSLPHKKRMYLSLAERVLQLSQEKENVGKSSYELTRIAILMPAPEFFIGWESFKKTFRNAKRYGINFQWKVAKELNKQYTNRKDNKDVSAVYSGKKFFMTK